MKPSNMTKNFSTCLEGLTLPSGVIYGNVSGISYYYNPDTKKLSIYDKYTKKWRFANPDKYQRIMHYIHAFMRSDAYSPEKVRWCQHKQKQRDERFRADKRLNRDLVKKHLRHERELLACGPQEKRPQTDYVRFDGSCYSQAAIEGKLYRPNNYGENACIKKDGVTVWNDRGYKLTSKTEKHQENPFPVHGDENRPLLQASDPNRNFFENAEGKYVTITKRDGMAINQTKIRPQKAVNREFKISRGGESFTIRETINNGKSEVKIV